MAKKSASKSLAPEPSPSSAVVQAETAVPAADAPLVPRDRQPVIKVNTANLSELKTAVDDVVKEYFSDPSHRFSRSYVHDDVRLALGWAAVAVAGATGWYGYKTQFRESKELVGSGVVVYVVLNTVLALYAAFVEKNTIFVGKRRTFSSRITTELLTLSSLASASSSHTTSSSWVPFPISLLAPSPKSPATPSSSAAPVTYPLYTLTLTHSHSSNANKSLLHAKEVERTHAFGGWFDEEGRIARRKVERWLEEGLREVVGDEEKEE
ncbi:hypothetical protein JCM11641_003877 [Rhodosporidiobolus odoratus]